MYSLVTPHCSSELLTLACVHSVTVSERQQQQQQQEPLCCCYGLFCFPAFMWHNNGTDMFMLADTLLLSLFNTSLIIIIIIKHLKH